MKKWIVFVVAALLAANSFATLLPAETGELSVSGMLDFDSASETYYNLNFFLGYFFVDYLEAGIKTSFEMDDFFTFWSVGPAAEYNFDLGIELVPYVGLSLEYASADSDIIQESASAFVLGTQGGVKYFFTEYLALSTALVIDVATDDIYAAGDKLTNYDIKLVMGMRFFF